MEKTYISKQKFLLGSPRKLRLVVAVIKKLTPMDALLKLPFVSKKAAFDLGKVIKSALANARNQGASDTDLVFKEIQIGQGPNLKRGRAASRGRWHGYVKKMSHITVVLTTKQLNSSTVKENKEEKIDTKQKKVSKIAKKSHVTKS